MGGLKSGMWTAVDINQRIINNAVAALHNSASASGLACKQKEDILNIFFN